MELNSLLESLREVTRTRNAIKEGDENNSSYTGSTATEPKDIHSAVTKIAHEWDTYKMDPSFPDNVKVALEGALGQINPGNADAVKDAETNLKTDQATQKTEMAGDVKAVSDQDKFVPKVGEAKVKETTMVGKQTDATKKAEGVAKKELKKDQDTEKKELAGDKKEEKVIGKETGPGKGKSEVK